MVNVVGLGYIGLPTALMMASHGVEVTGTDCNGELVATLKAEKTTFKEDGLDELFVIRATWLPHARQSWRSLRRAPSS